MFEQRASVPEGKNLLAREHRSVRARNQANQGCAVSLKDSGDDVPIDGAEQTERIEGRERIEEGNSFAGIRIVSETDLECFQAGKGCVFCKPCQPTTIDLTAQVKVDKGVEMYDGMP